MENGPRCCGHSTEAGTAMCALADSGKPPPLCFKTKQNQTITNQTKQIFFSAHKRMFGICCWAAFFLCFTIYQMAHSSSCQEKYLFPILIMLPDYPLVYILPGLLSIHAAIWKILKLLWGNLSPIVLARAGICSRGNAAIPREGLMSLFVQCPIKMKRHHCRGPWGVTGRALV